jgi:hypothetical protein
VIAVLAAGLLAVTLTADPPDPPDDGGPGGPGPVSGTAVPLPPLPRRPKLAPPPGAPETMSEAPHQGEIPNPEVPIPEKKEGFWGTITPPYELGKGFLGVPVPVVYSDPNIGVGAGIMPVFLYRPGERIEVIFAPSVDYNEIVSATFASRLFWYPTVREEFLLYDSVSLVENTEHEIHFHGRDRFFEHTDFFARADYFVDGTRRFFGLGADTTKQDETNYEQREFGAEADLGYRIFDDRVRLGATVRYRRDDTTRGIVKSLPQTNDVFPNVPGVGADELNTLAFGLHGTLDLRDSDIIPTDGLLLDVIFEAAPRGLISDIAFWRWKIDAVYHLPIVEDVWTHVMRATWHGVSTDSRTPFWELPTLGGDKNLRGFGLGRYTDDNYLLFTAEERARVFDFAIDENRLIIEFAGFCDVGRVYGRGGGLTKRDWNFVPGAGVRLLLPESGIIARADFGLGSDGLAAFVVLGYPF